MLKVRSTTKPTPTPHRSTTPSLWSQTQTTRQGGTGDRRSTSVTCGGDRGTRRRDSGGRACGRTTGRRSRRRRRPCTPTWSGFSPPLRPVPRGTFGPETSPTDNRVYPSVVGPVWAHWYSQQKSPEKRLDRTGWKDGPRPPFLRLGREWDPSRHPDPVLLEGKWTPKSWYDTGALGRVRTVSSRHTTRRHDRITGVDISPRLPIASRPLHHRPVRPKPSRCNSERPSRQGGPSGDSVPNRSPGTGEPRGSDDPFCLRVVSTG